MENMVFNPDYLIDVQNYVYSINFVKSFNENDMDL